MTKHLFEIQHRKIEKEQFSSEKTRNERIRKALYINQQLMIY